MNPWVRPRVLHVARDWVRPSEGFVRDLVTTTTATRSALVLGVRHAGVPLPPRAVQAPAGWERHTVAAQVVRHRAQVVHAHFGYWAEHAARAAHRSHRPLVVSLHGHDLLVEGCPAAAQATAVLVPSRFLADAASRAGVPDEVLRVVPCGVDLARLPWRARRRDESPPVVTFAGRYVAKKGPLVAVEAVARAQGRHGPLAVRFVGHGPLEPDVRRAAVDAGLDVTWVDGSRPGAVVAELARADVVLTPSQVGPDGDAETFGLVNLEALALGALVVSTRSGGIPEAVGDAADLAPEGDAVALSDALLRVLRDPGSWEERSRRGREHVAATAELGAQVAAHEEVWRTVAARQAPARPTRRTSGPTHDAAVVVVTFDRADLVTRCLAALRAQTVAPTEVVVVDNASADGTRDVLAALAQDWPALRVLRTDEHLPVALARNLAVRSTQTPVVAFTDDDCRPSPTWLEALLAGFRPGVSVVQGVARPDPAQQVQPLSRTQWTPAESGLYETCSIAYMRESFDTAGGFDEAFAREVADVLPARLRRQPFGEDTDLAWRVRRAGGRTAFAAGAVVHHEVFAPDRALLRRRAGMAAAWPVLVRRVPELRGLLTGRFVLGRSRLRWWAAVLGLVEVLTGLSGGHLLTVALGLTSGAAYGWGLVRPTRPGRRARIAAVPTLVRRDLVETVALVRGSWRARRPVL